MIKPRTLRIFFALSVLLIIVLLFMSFVTGCLKNLQNPLLKVLIQKKESPALEKIQGNIEYVIKEYEKTYIKQTAPPQILLQNRKNLREARNRNKA